MSQYSHVSPTGQTVLYGLDHHVGYFADVYENLDDAPIIEVYGRSNVVEVLTQMGAPSDHVTLIALDLPL